MTKVQMIYAVVRIMSPTDNQEQQRLSRYMATRTEQQVRESYSRWRSIAAVKQSEINKHCQMTGLPGM